MKIFDKKNKPEFIITALDGAKSIQKLKKLRFKFYNPITFNE